MGAQQILLDNDDDDDLAIAERIAANNILIARVDTQLNKKSEKGREDFDSDDSFTDSVIDGLYNKVRELKKKDAFVTINGKVLQPEKAKPHHKLRKKSVVRPEFDTRPVMASELKKTIRHKSPVKVMHSPPQRDSPVKK